MSLFGSNRLMYNGTNRQGTDVEDNDTILSGLVYRQSDSLPIRKTYDTPTSSRQVVYHMTAPPEQGLLQLSDGDFALLVNDAYKAFGSVLSLSRSPLATSPLVEPTLVLDNLTPAAADRGRGLQLVLRWAVEQLAPATPLHPLGTERPWDDPTWREPAWWRYTILRHRYVEPLHPDTFVEGGRFTETLIALTGIPSADTFFDERNRAIRAAADILRRQMRSGAADVDLRQRALSAACAPLARNNGARTLLGIAAAFDGVFPRSLLLSLAKAENLPDTQPALAYLIANRLLLAGDNDNSLWVSPPLREYIYQREPAAQMQVRHHRAASFFHAEASTLPAVRHLRLAGRWPEAAGLLLDNVQSIAGDLQLAELRTELEAFPVQQLEPPQWQRVQTQLSDVCAALGDNDAAVGACRSAMKRATAPEAQAPLFRRLGKLYEIRNQLHAISYYRQAEERFDPGDREMITLLKDRGWLYIHQREWDKALADLERALHLDPDGSQRANILDALAALHRYQQHYPDAIAAAEQALALREQSGDLLQVAKSLGNLGLLYTATGDHAQAIAAHREAHAVAQRLGNRELAAAASLNTGLAHHMAGDRRAAMVAYRASLALARAMNALLIELRALANLAEALAEENEHHAALTCWQAALDLAEREAFDDEKSYLLELAARFGFPLPNRAAGLPDSAVPLQAPGQSQHGTGLTDDDHLVLELARREGSVTPRRLMEAGHVSKATATRRLAALVEMGRIIQQGRGRNTRYVLPAPVLAQAAPAEAAIPHTESDLQTLLLRNLPWLAHSFGVRAIGWCRGESVSPQAPILVVRFARLPELLPFLELRGLLARRLGASVDLLPEQAVPSGHTVAWFGSEL